MGAREKKRGKEKPGRTYRKTTTIGNEGFDDLAGGSGKGNANKIDQVAIWAALLIKQNHLGWPPAFGGVKIFFTRRETKKFRKKN